MPVDEQFLKSLPTGPGVYLMTDGKGNVLYVGKAGNLKNQGPLLFCQRRR